MTTHLLRPSALTLAASLALLGISSAGAAAIDSLLTVIRGEGVPPGVLTCCDLVERGSVAPPPHRTHP